MTTSAQDEVLAILSEHDLELYKTGKMVFSDGGKSCALIMKEEVYPSPAPAESLTLEQKAILDALNNREMEFYVMVGKATFWSTPYRSINEDGVFSLLLKYYLIF